MEISGLNIPFHRVSGGTAAMMTLLVVLGGCGEESARSSALVRDSAGVAIVFNTTPVWSDGVAWRVAESPSTDIGVVSGAPEYELYRPLGAVRLSDGRMVVANQGTQDLRYYDEDGRFLYAAGGRGGGPGEFFNIAWFGRVEDDSLVVHDRRSRRVSIFDPDGKYVRAIPFATGFPQIEGRLNDGSYVARVVPVRLRGAPPLPTGRGQDSLFFMRFGADGQALDTLGVFLRRVRHGHSIDFMGRHIRGAIPIPFGPSTVLRVVGERFFVGTSNSFQVSEFSAEGVLRRLVRKGHTPLAVQSIHHDRFLDSVRAQYATGGPEAKVHVRLLEETPPPDSMPAFASFLVDRVGNLWVSDVQPPHDKSVRWNVFDNEGIWLGTVNGPDGYRVTDIGSDYMLGLWKDDLEVEHALLYELIKS